jgi:phage terminase small subunit
VNLTAKQEKFVQGIISGLTQREAYKKAGYSTENKPDEYIDKKASETLKNGKVWGRYQELLKEHQNKALWTREQAVTDLIWLKEQARENIQHIGVKQANSNAFLNAVKELNSLEDLYKKEAPEEEFEDDGFLAALDSKEVNWDEET